MRRSFYKERKNVAFFWKECMPSPAFFHEIYNFLWHFFFLTIMIGWSLYEAAGQMHIGGGRRGGGGCLPNSIRGIVAFIQSAPTHLDQLRWDSWTLSKLQVSAIPELLTLPFYVHIILKLFEFMMPFGCSFQTNRSYEKTWSVNVWTSNVLDL